MPQIIITDTGLEELPPIPCKELQTKMRLIQLKRQKKSINYRISKASRELIEIENLIEQYEEN